MDARRLFVAARVVGALLVAAGIGGAVLGGYAAVQADAGWCGHPTVFAVDAEGWGGPAGNGSRGSSSAFPVVGYESLSPAERRAVEHAIEGPDDVGEVTGPFPHAETFEEGVLVRYGGERYYATVASFDECVDVPPPTFPAGLAVAGLGLVTYLVPAFPGRTTGEGQTVPLTRNTLRTGPLAEPALLGAFGAGVLLAVLYPAGVLVAGALVGVTATSRERAVVLGGYVGATVALVAALFTWLGLGWTPPTLPVPGLPGWRALAVEAALAVVASVVARLLT